MSGYQKIGKPQREGLRLGNLKYDRGSFMSEICPLLMIAVKEPGFISDLEEKQARCLKEDCAWYMSSEVEGKGGCAIKVLAESRQL